MNQYEKEIQALKYRCRKLEQQCSMFESCKLSFEIVAVVKTIDAVNKVNAVKNF